MLPDANLQGLQTCKDCDDTKVKAYYAMLVASAGENVIDSQRVTTTIAKLSNCKHRRDQIFQLTR